MQNKEQEKQPEKNPLDEHLEKYSWLWEDDSPYPWENKKPKQEKKMAITRAEFETARKMVQEAIVRHGDLRTALLTITNKLELEAIQKSMKVIADYFVQTRQPKQEQKTK